MKKLKLLYYNDIFRLKSRISDFLTPFNIGRITKYFDERKKEPLDYRRNGVITICVGIDFYLFRYYAFVDILKGDGALVGLIGVGTMNAGYLYIKTGKEITSALEKFEKQ